MEINNHQFTRSVFINKIFSFYKVVDENNVLKQTYDRALSVKYPVEWAALYEHIIKTAETRILPLPKFFVDKLPLYKKKSECVIENEGAIIRVILDNDRYYDFTVVSFDTKTTLGSIQKKFSYKDELGAVHTRIKKIIRYPKGTTFIGNSVYFDVDLPNADKMTDAERETTIAIKEAELKKQVKVLFTV